MAFNRTIDRYGQYQSYDQMPVGMRHFNDYQYFNNPAYRQRIDSGQGPGQLDNAGYQTLYNNYQSYYNSPAAQQDVQWRSLFTPYVNLTGKTLSQMPSRPTIESMTSALQQAGIALPDWQTQLNQERERSLAVYNPNKPAYQASPAEQASEQLRRLYQQYKPAKTPGTFELAVMPSTQQMIRTIQQNGGQVPPELMNQLSSAGAFSPPPNSDAELRARNEQARQEAWRQATGQPNYSNYMTAYNTALNPQGSDGMMYAGGTPGFYDRYPGTPLNQSQSQPQQPAPSPTNPPITAGGTNPGLNNYINSPGYQLQFGLGSAMSWLTNPVSIMSQQHQLSLPSFLNSDAYKVQYGENQAANPYDRFKNDPGVQGALAEGTRQLSNAYAAKGLGASGAAAAGLSQFLMQNYNDFTKNQGQLYETEYNRGLQGQLLGLNAYQTQQALLGQDFRNYQNNLAGLGQAGMGFANQLGQNYLNTGGQLGNFLGQGYQNIGSLLGQWGLGTSGDIASLLAQLGYWNGNNLIGLGGAISNNMFQGSQLGAQLQNQINASQPYGLSGGLFR